MLKNSTEHAEPLFIILFAHKKKPTRTGDIPLTICNWKSNFLNRAIDDYAKDGGPGEVRLLCSFYHESLRTWIKTIVNKFAISNHTALILGVHSLRSYLQLICEH